MTPSQKPQDSGAAPAFPVTAGKSVFATGANLRDWFAAHAPITFDVVMLVYGGEPHITQDADRAAFFAVWTMLQYEYADAMLAAREAQP
ncbi:hypothetical protein [Paracoccus yeei]|uniref:hypothetical protein n=1 Tax=Paracoccus yeei TaxID=147645 RepID=UPI00174D5592|nr:hypothetical protein [Paracoccus yeei]